MFARYERVSLRNEAACQRHQQVAVDANVGPCQDNFADRKPAILDLRKGELYVADALPANIEEMVRTELAWLDGFFKSYSKAA
jgi:hypothetical protein